MKNKNLWCASVAFAALTMVNPALAQTPAASDIAEREVETIVVYGVSGARQSQTVTQAAIELSTPGVSPLKAIERLPGVNFQSADSLGPPEIVGRSEVSQGVAPRGRPRLPLLAVLCASSA